MLAHQFCQRHIGLFSNRSQLGVAAPIAQELLSVLVPQSADERVSPLLFDPPILIAMTAIRTGPHCLLSFLVKQPATCSFTLAIAR
jgi:hypothetical protein